MTADAAPPGPIPLDDALAIIRDVARPIKDIETIPLSAALGRSLIDPAVAPRALPPFDNTAVDGYAFRRADAPGEGTARLPLRGESAAGIPFTGTLPPGVAIRISTGAVLPGGADTVAMQEDCQVENGHVLIHPVPPHHANVRFAGNDIALGDIAIEAGRTLRPQDIALLSALGLTHARVKRKLRIAIAATGAELREGGTDLGPGQIVESNGLMLSQFLANFPVETTLIPSLPDDRAATEAALAEAGARYDLILTTGGVSVGDHDHVRPALQSQGKVHFWRLAIRPGKPVLFGEVGGALMLGLPGNPVSAMVTFLMVALPVIKALLGYGSTAIPGFPVELAEPLTKPPKLREFPRVRLEWRDGVQTAIPYRDQSSNLLTSLVWADGILDIPAGPSELAAGETVIYRPFTALLG